MMCYDVMWKSAKLFVLFLGYLLFNIQLSLIHILGLFFRADNQ